MDFSNSFSQDFAALAAAPPDPTYGDARYLLTLERVKEILGISSSTEDAKLSAAMPIVTELFENYCRRGLAFDIEEVEEHPVTMRIGLFRYPLHSVDLFMIDDIEQSDPKIDRRHGFVLYGSNGAASSVASVTYAGGYHQDDVPYDLADAYAKCSADFAGVSYTSSGSTGGGAPLKSLSLGSGALAVSFDTASSSSLTYDASAVPTILQPYYYTLERYRMKDFV